MWFDDGSLLDSELLSFFLFSFFLSFFFFFFFCYEYGSDPQFCLNTKLDFCSDTKI